MWVWGKCKYVSDYAFFCIAVKLRCVEKVLRRIELQKIHKPSDNDIVNKKTDNPGTKTRWQSTTKKSWRIRASFLSFVLRHKPEAIGIVLDREGWADIDKLILCAQKAGKRLTRALLDTVVATSDKKRFSYSSDGRCIRAVQGHSTSQVAISFAEKTPPQFLYHGTASRFLDEIKKQGLIAGERHYVHLSADEATARKVGARHGSPVILTVKAQEMAKRGLPFWQAENGVWLTSTVAVEFLEW